MLLRVTERFDAPISTDELKFQQALVVEHWEIGNLLQHCGALDEALRCFAASRQVGERVMTYAPDHYAMLQYLTGAYLSIGDIFKQKEKLEDCTANYRTAFSVAQRLVEANPDNAQWRANLAAVKRRLDGAEWLQSALLLQQAERLLAARDTAGAIPLFQASLALQERAAADTAPNSEQRQFLYATCLKLGDILLHASRGGEALMLYDKALRLLDVVKPPDLDRCRAAIATNIGDALAVNRQWAESVSAFRQALAATERLTTKEPADPRWKGVIAVRRLKLRDAELAQQIAARGMTNQDVIAQLNRSGISVVLPPGATPLHAAAGNGYAAVAQQLLAQGADPNALVSRNTTPLHVAALNGQIAVARLLLAQGAALDARDSDGWTALMLAATRGFLPMVQLLIEVGANIDVIANDGTSALQAAIDHEPIVHLLVSKTTQPNGPPGSPWPPLFVAAGQGYVPTAQALIDRGANVAFVNQAGATALHMAAEHGHTAVARLLIEHGAPIDARGRSEDTPLLHAAAGGFTDFAQLLIEKGANVDIADKSGWTPLHCAAEKGNDRIVQMLLVAGAAADIKTLQGATAADVARARGKQSTLAVLTARAVKE